MCVCVCVCVHVCDHAVYIYMHMLYVHVCTRDLKCVSFSQMGEIEVPAFIPLPSPTHTHTHRLDEGSNGSSYINWLCELYPSVLERSVTSGAHEGYKITHREHHRTRREKKIHIVPMAHIQYTHTTASMKFCTTASMKFCTTASMIEILHNSLNDRNSAQQPQ